MGTTIRSPIQTILPGLCVALVVLAGPARAAAQDLRLVTAAAAQDWSVVDALLEHGVDVDTPRADGATPLLWAVHWDHLDLVDTLLAAGADVDAADDHGVTPLERAAENGSLPIVERLLAAGADATARRHSGYTPLMAAARTGRVDVVSTLLAAGAEVNAAVTRTGSTALMWAVAESHTAVIHALLASDADPHRSTIKGFTPLLFAARNGDIEVARVLLDAGVSVNETGSDGTHVLPYAIIAGQDRFALFLLEEGADPDASLGGVRALHAAAGRVGTWLGDWRRRHGDGRRRSPFGREGLEADRALPLIEALLSRGADPNARITSSAMLMSYIGYPRKGAFEPFACGTGDLRGATPLWVAAHTANGSIFSAGSPEDASGRAEIIRRLLDAGADPHLTTDDGTTPFMAAAGLGRSTYRPRQPRGLRSPSAEVSVRLLLEAGAEINARNEADFTALHGAAFRGLNEVVTYLVEHGADIDARDFRGRTPFRLAEGSKQSFQFQSWPETADLLLALGANPRLGIPGTVQERLRDVPRVAEGQAPAEPLPDVTETQIERWKAELSNWGRWGARDQIGTLNLITPEKRRQAAALVRDGVSVSLARTAETEETIDNPRPYEVTPLGITADAITISYHGFIHTHLDFLNHNFIEGITYNGYRPDPARVEREGAHPRNTVLNAKQGIFTRGLLIDMARFKGVEYLEPGTAITVEDLEAWEDETGLTVSAGDAVFIRTGRWARRREVGPWDIANEAAGLHASVIPWLRERDIAILGGEAPQDVAPAGIDPAVTDPDDLGPRPLHRFALIYLGMPLFDNVDLDALGEAAAERGRWEFLLTAAPLPTRGTGSPINPIATF